MQYCTIREYEHSSNTIQCSAVVVIVYFTTTTAAATAGIAATILATTAATSFDSLNEATFESKKA